jgi:hypothetical protein
MRPSVCHPAQRLAQLLHDDQSKLRLVVEEIKELWFVENNELGILSSDGSGRPRTVIHERHLPKNSPGCTVARRILLS